MTDSKKFKNESQDARRHDQHNAAHPNQKNGKNSVKSNKNSSKSPDFKPNQKR